MKQKVFVICMAVLLVALCPLLALAGPVKSFGETGQPVFDDWDVCRTSDAAPYGYLKFSPAGFEPVITVQSLGASAGIAYQLGQKFAEDYPDTYQRAEKVFDYVRNIVQYTPDIDQFGRTEYAQNADEMAATVGEKGSARGDCEDYAIFLAVMYKGAGYRSAIVLVKKETGGHVATLVYLPGYIKANRFLSVNGETGWVWAEATGKTNHLGWAPESFSEDNVKLLLTREVK